MTSCALVPVSLHYNIESRALHSSRLERVPDQTSSELVERGDWRILGAYSELVVACVDHNHRTTATGERETVSDRQSLRKMQDLAKNTVSDL